MENKLQVIVNIILGIILVAMLGACAHKKPYGNRVSLEKSVQSV